MQFWSVPAAQLARHKKIFLHRKDQEYYVKFWALF